MDRRTFLVGATQSGLGLITLPYIHTRPKARPYGLALIGCGWWGNNILQTALAHSDARVVALCDVDAAMLTETSDTVASLTGERPATYEDFRELFAGESPEIVIVATPDHWHPLITIAAVEKGAHVYVEKPIGHTLLEGRAMVEAARATDRVVQVGTHRRVSPHNVSGMEFLKTGRAGKIGMVRAFVHGSGGPGQVVPDEEPPPGLNWDLWCGPAPLRPFNPSIHPRGFRMYLDYANGQLGDWGIHWLDQILWWTDEPYPRKIHSTGGRYIRTDQTDAPDTQVVTYEFESFQAVWEHRQYAGNQAEKASLGCYFYGTEGTFHMGWRDGWTFYPRNANDPVIHEDPYLHEPDQQNIKELWADFINAVETNRRPVCDIEVGHRSTSMSLLGMLSLKLGRSIDWDGARESILGDPEANALLRREYRSPWVYPSV